MRPTLAEGGRDRSPFPASSIVACSPKVGLGAGGATECITGAGRVGEGSRAAVFARLMVRENPGVWRWYFYRKSFWCIVGARRRGLAFGVTALGV